MREKDKAFGFDILDDGYPEYMKDFLLEMVCRDVYPKGEYSDNIFYKPHDKDSILNQIDLHTKIALEKDVNTYFQGQIAPSLQDDSDIAFKLLTQPNFIRGWADHVYENKMSNLSPKLANDKDFIIRLVDGISESISKDEHSHSPKAKIFNVRYMSDELKADKDFVKDLFTNHCVTGFENVSDEIKHDVKFLASVYSDKNVDKDYFADILGKLRSDDNSSNVYSKVPSMSQIEKMAKVLKAADNAKDDKNVAKDGLEIK